MPTSAILAIWGIKSTFGGLIVTVWDQRLPSGAAPVVEVGKPALPRILPGSLCLDTQILPMVSQAFPSILIIFSLLAFEGRGACTGIILLSAFFSSRKQRKPQWHSELLFRKETYILGCLFCYSLAFVPERHPSNLMSSEFKCSVQSFEIYFIFFCWSLYSFRVQS